MIHMEDVERARLPTECQRLQCDYVVSAVCGGVADVYCLLHLPVPALSPLAPRHVPDSDILSTWGFQ